NLIPVFNDYPLSRIIVHPRTGTQMYGGEADLETFFEALPQFTCPVVYNGDIRKKKSFRILSERFDSIDEWMIGRGAISDPFLPGDIKDSAPKADRIRIVQDFHEYLFDSYREVLFGPKHILDKMKEIWSFLCISFSNGNAAYATILRSRSIVDYLHAVRSVFSNEEWIA
ncbi:MAG: tRNA-dihydrouridine synthase family protein, partial [Spirochaetales bacterium]